MTPRIRIRGDLHFHSMHSACHGKHTVGAPIDWHTHCGIGAFRELIEASRAAKAAGYEYFAVTNHATDPLSVRDATIKERRLLKVQAQRIRLLKRNNACAVPVLSGVEVNIVDRSGRVNVPATLLRYFDVVIASNHRPTEGLLRKDVLSGFLGIAYNKRVHIIGHMTRFIHHLTLDDWRSIIRAYERHGKIIEYNVRAPLPEPVVRIIARSKVFLSLGSDTHPDTQRPIGASMVQNFKALQVAALFLQKRGIRPARIVNARDLRDAQNILRTQSG